MSVRQHGSRSLSTSRIAGSFVFAASCVAAMPAHAADSSNDEQSLSELRAENARLRQQLQQIQGGHGSSDNVGPSSASTIPAATAGNAGGGSATGSVTGPAAGSADASASAVSPATAGDGGPDSADNLGVVVVTARNRAEKLQDVPIPVSVVSGKTLETQGQVTFADFAKHTAGLIVNPQNARQSSISMRGLGKQGATDAAESSVGIIVDDVFLAYGAYSWADFVDIDNVQVLRGPQGTLLGKNTTLGVINVSTRLPSFKPEYTFESTIGNNHTFIEKASATGPLIDGILAYRASVSANRADGTVRNAYPDGSTFTNANRYGGRLQLLFTPAADLSARIILNHQTSSEYDNGGNVLLSDPSSYANGASRTGSNGRTFTSRLSRDWFNGYQPSYGGRTVNINAQLPVENTQDGLSAEVKWNINDYTLTSISAYNRFHFNARNDTDYTPFDIGYNSNTDAKQWQASQEIRLNSPIGGPIDYQVGLYALRSSIETNSKTQNGSDAGAFLATNAQYASLSSTAAGRQLLSDSLRGVYTKQTQWPTTTSLAAYGQANWHVTDRATLTAGVRETDEYRNNNLQKTLVNGGSALGADDATAQKYFGVSTYAGLTSAQQAQISNATAIRSTQIGSLYGFTQGSEIHQYSTSWLLSPSFKLTDNVLLYSSVSYGQKSGIVLFNTSDGTRQNANPEKALDFELGFKSALLNRSLIFNANLYQTTINGYQQLLQQVDPTQASGYRSVTGNADRVVLRGVELDSAYTGLKNFVFTLAGAYGTAKYSSFKNATCAPEITGQAVCDYSGQQLPGASKLTFNFGVDYARPFGSGYLFHSSLNVSYRSRSNLDSTLSSYGWQKGYALTDIGIGFGRADGKYDLTLLVKNLFNTEYALAKTSFSSTLPVYEQLGDSRFIGVVMRAKFN